MPSLIAIVQMNRATVISTAEAGAGAKVAGIDLDKLRNEEFVVPNSQFSGGVLINYSRLNDAEGVVLPV